MCVRIKIIQLQWKENIQQFKVFFLLSNDLKWSLSISFIQTNTIKLLIKWTTK